MVIVSWSCVTVDLSSASELSDNDSDDSDSRELSGYSCRHCYTTSERLLYDIPCREMLFFAVGRCVLQGRLIFNFLYLCYSMTHAYMYTGNFNHYVDIKCKRAELFSRK